MQPQNSPSTAPLLSFEPSEFQSVFGFSGGRTAVISELCLPPVSWEQSRHSGRGQPA